MRDLQNVSTSTKKRRKNSLKVKALTRLCNNHLNCDLLFHRILDTLEFPAISSGRMVSYGLCYSNLSHKNLGEEIVFSDVQSNFNHQPDGQDDADSKRKTNDS